MATENILEIDNLNVGFVTERGTLKALRNVDLTIPNGAIVGVVGESGCGKTTTGRAILRAVDPTDGKVLFRMKNGDVVDLYLIHISEPTRPLYISYAVF